MESSHFAPYKYKSIIQKLKQKVQTQAKRLRLLEEYREICDQVISEYSGDTSVSSTETGHRRIHTLGGKNYQSQRMSYFFPRPDSSQSTKSMRTKSEFEYGDFFDTQRLKRAGNSSRIQKRRRTLETDLEDAVKTLEKAQIHLMDRENQIEKMGKYIQDLIMRQKQQLEMYQKLKIEKKELERQNQLLENNLSKMEQEKSQFFKIIQEKQEKVRSSFQFQSKLEISLLKKDSIIEKLEGQIKEIQEKTPSAKENLQSISVLTDQVCSLNNQIQKLQVENCKLNIELSSLKASEQPYQTQTKIEKSCTKRKSKKVRNQNKLLQTYGVYFDQCSNQILCQRERLQQKIQFSNQFMQYLFSLKSGSINILQWITKSGQELELLAQKFDEEEMSINSQENKELIF